MARRHHVKLAMRHNRGDAARIPKNEYKGK